MGRAQFLMKDRMQSDISADSINVPIIQYRSVRANLDAESRDRAMFPSTTIGRSGCFLIPQLPIWHDCSTGEPLDVSTLLKSRLGGSDLRERMIPRGRVRLIIKFNDRETSTASSCIALYRPLVVLVVASSDR